MPKKLYGVYLTHLSKNVIKISSSTMTIFVRKWRFKKFLIYWMIVCLYGWTKTVNTKNSHSLLFQKFVSWKERNVLSSAINERRTQGAFCLNHELQEWSNSFDSQERLTCAGWERIIKSIMQQSLLRKDSSWHYGLKLWLMRRKWRNTSWKGHQSENKWQIVSYTVRMNNLNVKWFSK